ncbi:MAG: TolC family protein [Aquificaceae bacterium]|nr:TolC family protein [Aquificaceae bacterium]MDW8422784.1 TolC family protein [Aquificaceae bacterium]
MLLLMWLGFSFSLSLEELLQSALQENPKLLAKRYAIESARLNLKADRQLYYPEFLAGYKLHFQQEGQSIQIPSFAGFPVTEVSTSKRTYQSLQVGLRQSLYDGGLRSSKVQISKSFLNISEMDYEETLLSVKLEVVEAYLSVLSTLELLEVAKKQREAIASNLKQREAFFKEGLVAITDVLQAKVRLAEVERDLRQAEGNYRTALSNLSRLTGIKEEKLKELKPPLLEPSIPKLESLTEKALQNRPIIRLTKERLRIAKNQKDIELSQLYPKLFVEALYSYSDQNPALSPKGTFVLSAGLSLNFQSLYPYYRALAQAEEEKRAREELRDVIDSVLLSLKVAYENYLTAKDNLRVAEESLRFAEEFYRLSLEQYKNQIISGTDLLQAEASLTQARKAKVIAYYELLKAYYQILRQVGDL